MLDIRYESINLNIIKTEDLSIMYDLTSNWNAMYNKIHPNIRSVKI